VAVSQITQIIEIKDFAGNIADSIHAVNMLMACRGDTPALMFLFANALLRGEFR
jgi:hypothetical protein